MKKQSIPLYICLLASAASLLCADQKPNSETEKQKPPIVLRETSEEYSFGTQEKNSAGKVEWQFGQDIDPDPEIAQQIESRAGQPLIKFPVANIAVSRQPWGRGIETNPELAKEMLARGVQKGFSTLPLASEGPSQSWASIDMTTPAQQPAPQEVRPFVWNEGKLPSQAIIDKFDAQAKKGPQRGIASLPSEPSSSDQ